MALAEVVNASVRNAFARSPAVDRGLIERELRSANRSIGRRLGHVQWIGSLEAYIRHTADLLVEGWTADDNDPLSPPQTPFGSGGPEILRLASLTAIERQLWTHERGAHSTSRLTPSRRLPVYLNALDGPAFAADAAQEALGTAALAATVPSPRQRGFAAEAWWKYRDDHWQQTRAVAALPFLVQVAGCFAAGLYAAARWRRGARTRTLLIERPRLRVRGGLLHRADEAAVVWPDGSERWYWQGVAVPATIVASRDSLTAEQVARIDNQELRRVTLERLGWERFLETANAELRAQDDYGKLWATKIWLDGEWAHLVEVVNATAEPDGSYRRYFLRVPPRTRTAREAVAWTFGFDNDTDYIVAAAS